ncbi:MAG: Arc family DNA-binding protein [Planctomycetes bacterium]|nr:Arc family DNA-binding protein [Planctomycetota bacterium]
MSERKAFLVRLPKPVHDELRAWAAQEMRSLNAQIEYLLREALRKRGIQRPLDADAGSDAESDEESDEESNDEPGVQPSDEPGVEPSDEPRRGAE